MPHPPGPWVNGKRGWVSTGSRAEYGGFADSTRVISAEGLIGFGQLRDGAEVSILGTGGSWKSGKVEVLGPRRIWRITVARTRGQHTIFAGAGQLWPVTSPQRRFRCNDPLAFRTDALLPIVGSKFWKLVTVNPSHRAPLDPDGVLHGIVFGDGSHHKQPQGTARKSYCQVYLCNDPAGCDSRQLAPLFGRHGYRPVIRDDKQQIRFYGLPGHWKTLPPPSASPSYLRGFVAGWFAADGSIGERNPVAQIASARVEHLEWLQRIAARAGLAVTVNIGRRRSLSTFGPVEWYSLGLALSTLDPDFFLLPEKRSRYRPAQFVKQWKLVSLEPTDTVEPVYTVRVANGEYFAIEGNILVYANAA